MNASRKGPSAEERCKLLQQNLEQVQKENEQLAKAHEEMKSSVNKNKQALDQYLRQAEQTVQNLQKKLNELVQQNQSQEKVISNMLKQLEEGQQAKENVKFQVEEEQNNGETINESVIQTSPELQQLLDRAQQDEPIYFVDNEQRVWEIVPRDDLNFESNQQNIQSEQFLHKASLIRSFKIILPSYISLISLIKDKRVSKMYFLNLHFQIANPSKKLKIAKIQISQAFYYQLLQINYAITQQMERVKILSQFKYLKYKQQYNIKTFSQSNYKRVKLIIKETIYIQDVFNQNKYEIELYKSFLRYNECSNKNIVKSRVSQARKKLSV